MHVTRHAKVNPSWDLPKATEPGYSRVAWSLVGEDTGAQTSEVALVRLEPGNRSRGFHHHETEETYVVLEGRLGVRTKGEDEERILDRYDAAFFDPGEKHTYRCVGTEPVVLLSVHGGSEQDMHRDRSLDVEEKYDLEQ
ncbi:MAG: cupin domain-containing protein [Salinirussus sp.]